MTETEDDIADVALATQAAPPSVEADARHLVLIDGSGFIFRAFHALPPMTRADGTPVNAVFGFCNMLARLLRDHVGTHLAVVFDAGRVTFRNEMFGDYKAHRPEPPSELVPQFGLIRDATAAFGVPAIELAGYEADDLIASYAAAIEADGGRCTIVSSDKDLMQVVGGGTDMLDPIKQKPIGPAEIEEKFGVPPRLMVEVQALMGDSVDNVPGVPGVGPKKAAALILEYGTVERVLQAAIAGAMKPSKQRDALVAHADAARVSRQLVELRRDAPLPLPIEALLATPPEPERLGGWLEQMGFRSIRQRLGLHVAADGAAPAEAAETAPVAALAPPFGPYETITDEAALVGWLAAARPGGLLAIDTEAGGGDPLRAELVGLALCTAPGRACYVPLRHNGTLDAPAPNALPPDRLAALLAPLLADPGVLKVSHKSKYDLLLLSGPDGTAMGAPLDLTAIAPLDLTAIGPIDLTAIGPIDDTMLISYAQGAGAHGHELPELAARHLSHTPMTLDAVTGTGRARLAYADVPVERATAFAAEAADVTLRLWYALRPTLRAHRSLAVYEQMERRLVPILAAMERRGISIDAPELRRMSEDFGTRMAALETAIHAMAGHPFKLGSPKQLGEVLFDEMKLPGGRRMKTGAWGTDSSVLQGLAEQGHDLPARILDWRQLDKLKSTYADSLVDDVNAGTGRVHTNYQMAVTSTGRLSSYDPNLQNIPIRTEEGGRIRRAFVAAPGHVLVSADYSQIELRLLAHVADIPALKDSFSRGEDIHARTASEVFGVPMAGMDSATRRRAKAINFGIIYGISPFGLARNLGIDAATARSYIDAYFARYPEIRDYMERTREEARMHGFVLTPFGRRCWIPGIAEKNPARRAYAERQAINAPLQGGAADVIKRAMVRLPSALDDARLTARMLLQVHDELLFEAPDDEADRLAAVVRTVMEGAASLSVPLLVETGAGRSWAQAH